MFHYKSNKKKKTLQLLKFYSTYNLPGRKIYLFLSLIISELHYLKWSFFLIQNKIGFLKQDFNACGQYKYICMESRYSVRLADLVNAYLYL